MNITALLARSLLLTALLVPATATASPWTLRRGRALLNAGFDFQLANSEFIDKGPRQVFPLNGRYSGATFNLGARLGISDRFELEASLPIKVINYAADPVIIDTYQGNDPDAALEHYQNNILNFSQSSAGAGDLEIAGRYQFLLNPLAIAGELRLKAPTGYSGPEGTFGPSPKTVEEFLAADPALAQPKNIRDDVSLGDAQLDISATVLFGSAFRTGTFIRGGAGYDLRLGGAGDQLVADLRLGQALSNRVLLYLSSRVAYTIQQGRSVGVSITAIDPSLPASEFANGVNLQPIVRRLEYNALQVGGGLIWRVVESIELNAGYERIIWGRFNAATHTMSLSVGIKTNLFDEDPV